MGQSEIDALMNNPRDCASNPYVLFILFVLDTLDGMLISDDDYDEDEEKPKIWGRKIDAVVFDRLLRESDVDFIECALNKSPIRIGGHGYTIRHAEEMNKELLTQAFCFDKSDNDYIIAPDGVNVEHKNNYSQRKNELRENKSLLRKIVYVVDNCDDGWDSLSDIEAAAYCWYLNQRKEMPLDVHEWFEKYQGYFELSLAEVKSVCVNGELSGIYCFSAKLVDKWNKKNGWKSPTESVTDDEADEKWFKKENR